MPWYYIDVSHGGGHQSHTSAWVWREKRIPIKTSEDIRELVDDVWDSGHDWGGDFGSSAIFRVKEVKKLPLVVHERKELGARRRIEEAEKVLAALKKTGKHPARCTAETPRWPNDERLKHLTSRCRKALGHKGPHVPHDPSDPKDPGKPGRDFRERFGDW